MSSSSLRENEHYYKIENYAMKCRMYPNKEVAQKIDAAIYGIQSFYNCTLYEMFSNHNLVTERKRIKMGMKKTRSCTSPITGRLVASNGSIK